MVRRILAILLLGMCLKAYTQEQIIYEYWFDEAYNLRDAATAQAGNVQIDVDVSQLEPGVHLFNFRVMDSHSHWSAPSTTCFLILPKAKEKLIQKYEYWFDDRDSERKVSMVTSGILSIDVDVTSLSDGIHTFCFRAQSDDGKWSAPSTTMFLKNEKSHKASLTQYEYWVDDKAEQKTTGKAASGLINLDVDVSQVKPGMHCLYFRMQDDNGKWNAPLSHCFVKTSIKTDNKIQAYRYWFNGAYEDAKLIELQTPVTPLELVVNIPVDNIRQHAEIGDTIIVEMENGQQEKAVRNQLFLQFRDVYQQWGSVQVDTFATLIDQNLIVPQDLAILAELYQSTAGDSLWHVKWPALNQEINSNELAGISTYAGHVTAINLKSNNLHGTFPHVIFGLDSLQVLNLEDNQISGTLTVQSIPSNLNELFLAGNRISMLTGVIPTTVSMLSLSRQQMDVIFPFNFSEQSLLALVNQVPNVCLYDQQRHTFSRNTKFTITGDPSVAMPLAIIQMEQGETAIELNERDGIVYTKASGDTLYCYDDLANRFMLKFNYDAGDANFDGLVNVQDLAAVVMFSLQTYKSAFNFGAANLWEDSVVNVQDAVCLVNVLLDAVPQVLESQQAAHSRSSSHQKESVQALLSCSDGMLNLVSPVPVSAFDILLTEIQASDVKAQIESLGFVVSKRQQGSGTHLIGYSPIGSVIPSGQTTLATLGNNNTAIRAALLADNHAKSVSVISPNATNINKVLAKMVVDASNGYIQIATSEPLGNISWKLLSVSGAMLDGGNIDVLPIGISRIPYKVQTDGVALLQLTADGCQPVVKKVFIR
jgi:Leucine-rich repeat (LRR) protein